MTKHECELMKRLMDENEQLRARVKALEALTMPAPQQVPIYMPVPQIVPDITPYWQRQHPYRVDLFCSDGSYS